MKIVALTDIHGSYKKAEEIIRLESADVIIIGGDFDNRRLSERGGRGY